MFKKSLITLLLAASSQLASAQECVLEYIDENLENSYSQTVSSDQINKWRNWCSKGYTLAKLDKATQACVDNAIADARESMGADYGIRYDMLAEMQENCRADFFAPKIVDQFTLRATVDDPDGYTNVRSQKNAKSQIIARVSTGEQFTTYRQDGSWWQIKTANGVVGYIHTSRLRLLN